MKTKTIIWWVVSLIIAFGLGFLGLILFATQQGC